MKMAGGALGSIERSRRIDPNLLTLLDFKFRHNIPLTTEELSVIADFDAATLIRKRCAGEDAPPFVRIGRKVRYPPQPFLQWLTDRPLHRSTSEVEVVR
jgi:hypothetical protein